MKRTEDWYIIGFLENKGSFKIERAWFFNDRSIPVLYEKKIIDVNIAEESYGISNERINIYISNWYASDERINIYTSNWYAR